MTTNELRQYACKIAGVELPTGRRLPNGVPEKLAKYLCCSMSYAYRLLSGAERPNKQMVKLLENYAARATKNNTLF